ncbi:MAG: 1-acyl-sn-glycerol-3-phosphate acyltransferase, partial [Acidobacteria bacterium]|nr:1-acyl-sn-glycerol-3-phosphate acyltransferase [Acidobacteriota bacterium]
MRRVFGFLVRGYFRIALWSFFQRIEVEGLDQVPSAGPVLFVSNHANAFIDPFLIQQRVRRRIVFTAKSTLLRDPLLRFVMWSLGVIALHRRQDQALGADPKANRASLERCLRLLARGRALCIFPEGQSHSEPAMRSFKLGAARLALDYQALHPEGPPLRVVPVGLYYERKQRFRSTAWARFGSPLDLSTWRAAHPQGTVRDLSRRLELEVRRLQVDFDSVRDRQTFHFVADLLASDGRAPVQLGQEKRASAWGPGHLTTIRETRAALRSLDAQRLASIEREVERYRRKLRRLGVSPAEVFLPLRPGRAGFFLLRELELFLVGLPLRLWGTLNHWLPFWLVRGLTQRMAKDDDQVASTATFLALPIFPLFYGLQTAAVAWLAGAPLAVLYLVSLPYTGAVALLHRDRSGSAWRRSLTFLRLARFPAVQARLVAEGREILAAVRAVRENVARHYPELVLDLEDPRAREISWTGGKGANLAQTRQRGFPVPSARLVTSTAYRAFAPDSITGRIEELQRIGAGDMDAVRRIAAEIRDEIHRAPIPAPLLERVHETVAPLVERGPVAVRSSSTQEDLAGAAFAGQHDTFLHLTTVPQVLDKLRGCYASLWEERAVRYRLEKGFDLGEASMALVIQSMVTAEVAGVAFSVHPVTGSLDQVLVNAAYGLGETVVSGEGEVDQFVVDRESGEILESRIEPKSYRLDGSAAGGVVKVAVTESEAQRACLTPIQLRQVSELAQSAERALGFPQDIEWAFQGGDLFLLQSRPISAIPPRWTRDESAERFPNPMTPLTWEFTRDGFHESLNYSFELMGLPTFHGAWFEQFDGYIYGNQNAVELYARAQGLDREALVDFAALERYLSGPYGWARELPGTWMRDLDRYLLALGRLQAVQLERLEVPELWAHVLDIDRVGREYFRPNIAISLTQGALHRLLFGLVQAIVGP